MKIKASFLKIIPFISTVIMIILFGCPPGKSIMKNTSMNKIPRVPSPRINPVQLDQLTDEQQAYLQPYLDRGLKFNVFTTAANHPDAAAKFDEFAFYTNSASTLSPRWRELIILRTAWLTQSDYEWAQHSRIGLQAGLTRDEVQQIASAELSGEWTDVEKSMVRAVDELHQDTMISDETWHSLSATLSDQQLMDLIYTTGAYTTAAMLLNAMGVQLDPGLTGLPK